VAGAAIYGLWNYSQPVWLALAGGYVASGILIRIGGIVRRRFRPPHAPPAPERQIG
jgi:CDP-diacylglycerol--serine O-phosphatidyltransferase